MPDRSGRDPDEASPRFEETFHVFAKLREFRHVAHFAIMGAPVRPSVEEIVPRLSPRCGRNDLSD